MEMEKEGERLLLSELQKRLKKGDCVCEVGSGGCHTLRRLIDEYDITGYGIDPYGISLQEENLKCYQMEGKKISSLNVNFNLIYSIRSFHHLKWPEIFIEESYKSLKKGGYLIIVDWKWGTDTGINERYYSLSEIIEMYEDSNFKIAEKINGEYNFLVSGLKE